MGTSREFVARAMAKLRTSGIVATARRVVSVMDLERLRAWGFTLSHREALEATS